MGNPTGDGLILFVWAPGFYAAVEQADNVAWRGVPVIVGGDPKKRGNVTSASLEARDAGVLPGMALDEALALCPSAILRPTRLKRYREVAAEMRSLLRGDHDRIEELGPEGTFVDPAVPDPVGAAAELCVRLQGELALRTVAGIGPTKFVAYMAAQHAGPSGLRVVNASEARDFLAPFPVTEIWGLGPATAEKLAEHGITTIADLQRAEPETLEPIVPRNAARFLQLARGEDDDPLQPRPRPRSLSQERTLERPTVDLRTLGEQVAELATQVETLLARERRAAGTVTLGLFFVDGTQVTRTQSLETPVATAAQIADVGRALLARTQAGVRQVRRLKLQVTRLRAAGEGGDPRQLRLF